MTDVINHGFPLPRLLGHRLRRNPGKKRGVPIILHLFIHIATGVDFYYFVTNSSEASISKISFSSFAERIKFSFFPIFLSIQALSDLRIISDMLSLRKNDNALTFLYNSSSIVIFNLFFISSSNTHIHIYIIMYKMSITIETVTTGFPLPRE